jgi:hypothetical protein
VGGFQALTGRDGSGILFFVGPPHPCPFFKEREYAILIPWQNDNVGSKKRYSEQPGCLYIKLKEK